MVLHFIGLANNLHFQTFLGGWWNVESFSQISGNIAIEFGNHCYIKALDNGLFVLGPPHDEGAWIFTQKCPSKHHQNATIYYAGDPPSPEEILQAFPVNENKVTLKSGYGKYLGIDKNGIVVGRSDAVSALEQFEPVFQDGKLALLAANSKFVSISADDDSFQAQSMTAGPDQVLKVNFSLMDQLRGRFIIIFCIIPSLFCSWDPTRIARLRWKASERRFPRRSWAALNKSRSIMCKPKLPNILPSLCQTINRFRFLSFSMQQAIPEISGQENAGQHWECWSSQDGKSRRSAARSSAGST